MRIDIDTDVCIAAGNCARTAPELFDQDDDGTVVLLDARPDAAHREMAREAVDLCPSGCISISEDS
jgi:ferredoxin